MQNNQPPEDKKLKELLQGVDWKVYNISYGNIRLNIQNGKLESTAIERTYKEINKI